jgi:predicted metal-dependent hydrolase
MSRTPNYLAGYPPSLLAQVQPLIDDGSLGERLARRYPEAHTVRSDGALYEHVQALKARHMRSSPPLAKVAYDSALQRIHQALGTHTTAARVQGGQLKAKREIRVAAVFKEAPAAFLQMIVVHELAHLKERAHDKAFYALCCHMAPDYHQLEFDFRLWMTLRERPASAALSGQVSGPLSP